jgi:AmmeMemoRadiSam system protein A
MSSDRSVETEVSKEDKQTLLEVARRSIAHALEHGDQIPLNIEDYPEPLRQPRATFVTLHLNGELRGCIGTLEAHQPLVLDVAQNAYSAAFSDPRFLPVTAAESTQLEIHISILNPAQEIHFTSQRDLIGQLQPGVDGLILQEGLRRGTFLPSVWEQLPRPEEFFAHLKLKAGLPPDYWSPELQVWRYTTTSFP